MKNQPSLRELENRKAEILRGLRLPERVGSPDAPAFLQHLDMGFVQDLLAGLDHPWGSVCTTPQLTTFVKEVVQSSEDGQRSLLLADLEILQAAKDNQNDQLHEGAFGLVEVAFLVRVRGDLVHCLGSGRFLRAPLSTETITRLSLLSGIDEQEVQSLANAIPVHDEDLIEAMLNIQRRLRDSLEHAIDQHIRAVELNSQLLQSERTQSLGTLSGGVAHHFNNLLSVILGYSSFVLNRESLAQESTDALNQVAEAAQRGRRLTEEILAFAGSDVEEESACYVHDILARVLSLLESQSHSQVNIQTNFEATNDMVVTNPSSIRQIIFNLLTYALDEVGEGGLITVHTENTSLDEGSTADDFIKIEVTDSGDTTGDTSQPGSRTGLKLSSIYGAVGRLDGTITVSNEPDSLTRIEVLLPISRQEDIPAEEKKVRRQLAPSVIWVVDDDQIFREMCTQVLGEEGHTVKTIPNGREMQKQWRSNDVKPDLMIIDFSMPEYNGLELCQWLRAKGAEVPIILVSGFATNQPQIKKALRIKKTYFLQKPFSFREMVDTVTVALGETLIGD